MHRRFLASVLLALALAAALHVPTAAKRPRYLVCEVEQWGDLLLNIDAFDNVGGAVKHCVVHWRGRPLRFET